MSTLASRLDGVTFGQLAEEQPEPTKTEIERGQFASLTPLQQKWRTDGLVILPGFLPKDLRDAYAAARERLLPKDRAQRDNFWGGWHWPSPYLECAELKELGLYGPLTEVLRDLIGEEMGLHLTLTGWVSTERNFHQDTYLNPPHLWSYYLAVWMALDDIHADSGPFEFVRGSHNWKVLRRHKLFEFLTKEEQHSPDWPTFTQDWVSEACKQEIASHGAKVEQFVPKGGDVLIWHSNLIHRGSPPRDTSLLRRSLICHYSSIHRRPDMKDLRVHSNGSHYFHFPPPAPVVPPAAAPVQAPKRRSLLKRLFG